MYNPIYEPRAKAREYCDLALNIYTGCPHGCTYCYAPRVLRKSKAEFSQAAPRAGILKATKKQLAKMQGAKRRIMLCFTCDPYSAYIDTGLTREIIQAIKESGNRVQILTKGGLQALRDFDLLDHNDCFGVTVSGSEKSIQEAEPNAADYFDRLYSLQWAHDRGIPTWVSCEPVLDTEAIYQLIREGDYIDRFCIGKLNYLPSAINWAEFGRMCEGLCQLYGRNYYLKADLRREMEVDGKRYNSGNSSQSGKGYGGALE